MLQRHEASLRLVYERYAYGTGAVGNELDSRKLLGMDEWASLMGDLDWIDGACFHERDASLCFVFSRLRVVHEANTKGRAKVRRLSRFVHVT